MGGERSALDIASSVKNGSVSAQDAVAPYLKNINDRNAELNAVITTVGKPEIEEQLAALEKKLSAQEDLPLAGVPIVVKDNISTNGIRTTCASKILGDFIPVYDAGVIERLKAAGAVIVAKANLDEFAMGSSNEFSGFGPVKNPWAKDRIPGGSSGGSAAAVAADFAPLALGSDTGGSIRQPAALCGVVGLKPTYGSVSRYGLVSYASSLDQIGPMAQSVDEVQTLFDVIRGKDDRDATSLTYEENAHKPKQINEYRLGIIKQFVAGLDDDIKSSFEDAVTKLKDLGVTVDEIDMPELDYALASYYVIATAEASSNLARFDGIRYGLRDEKAETLHEVYLKSRSAGFGPEVKQRIMLGTFALASGYYDAYYGKATAVRKMIEQAYNKAVGQYDFLISPTSPIGAWKIGEKLDDPIKMYLSDICTVLSNLTGAPALSLPMGYDANGVPTGLQIMGKHFGEAPLFHLAKAFEAATPDVRARSAYE